MKFKFGQLVKVINLESFYATCSGKVTRYYSGGSFGNDQYEVLFCSPDMEDIAIVFGEAELTESK